MNKAIKEILRASKKSSADYIQTFQKHERMIIKVFGDPRTLNSEIYLNDPVNYQDLLKFASLLSDKASLFSMHSLITDYHVSFPDSAGGKRTRQVTVPSPLTSSFRNAIGGVGMGYLYWNDNNVRSTFDEIEPLVKSEKALLRPTKLTFTPSKKPGVNHDAHYVDPNSPDDHWHVLGGMPKNSLPIYYGSNLETPGNVIFDATLPYFKDLSLVQYDKVLKAEKDSLSSFRTNVKAIVNEISSNNLNVDDIVHDKINPNVDSINRSFETIRDEHRFNVGSSLGLFSASLVALTFDEFITIMPKVVASAGSLLNMIRSDLNYRKKLDELKENPYFLLWRLQKRNV